MLDRDALDEATEIVRRTLPPTPAYAWPLLARRTGCEVWVKHENHTPTGAFKVRGGLVLMERLRRGGAARRGVVSATRGNHGQSLAVAGTAAEIPVTIIVPHGNSVEKNAAMRAQGAELIEAGRDFDEAVVTARVLAEKRGLLMLPSFHPDLVAGVATYALELFRSVAELHTVYVPIGMGSGICGLIGTRDLLGLPTRIVGVVSTEAPAYALSVEAGRVVTTETATTIADGMACRIPDPRALEVIMGGVERIVRVSDPEVRAAIRAYHEDTHNTAEGAGAAPLAALMRERERMHGRRVGLILCGGNIDRRLLAGILAEEDAGPNT